MSHGICPQIEREKRIRLSKLSHSQTFEFQLVKVENVCLATLLSLNFELKCDTNMAFSSIVGKILMEKFDIKSSEVEGVHRTGITGRKGFMKI